MLIIVVLIVDVLAPFALASILLRHRSRWSAGRIALIAALPIPLLLMALSVYIAGDKILERRDGTPMELAITIGLDATVLYLIGVAVAAVTVSIKKGPPADDIADIFS